MRQQRLQTGLRLTGILYLRALQTARGSNDARPWPQYGLLWSAGWSPWFALRIYMTYALDPRSAQCRVVNRERTTRSDATAADQEAMPPRACTLAEFSCGPAGSRTQLASRSCNWSQGPSVGDESIVSCWSCREQNPAGSYSCSCGDRVRVDTFKCPDGQSTVFVLLPGAAAGYGRHTFSGPDERLRHPRL